MKGWQKLSLAALVSATLIACAGEPRTPAIPEGFTLIEQVDAAPGEVRIPYQKYRLENGLTVILSPDDSDPLVHVDVTYHVGSAREELGKSGFAHFFEHMMFQGSKHVADEQHFQLVTEAGGTLNGTTNSDRTNYFETVPDNQLEKMLWLEADRMGFLLDAVTEEAFEIQRATVKNERGQRVDNRPYGRLNERVGQAMYPQGHPYSWPVIGWMEDLDRGNVEDLRRFFLRWYGPNNATLTIGGDFDVAQTLAWVEKYFGPIPRGPEVENAPKQPATLESDRYISMEDKVHLPLVYMSFPTVYARHEDEAALDLLADILGGGRTSIFYKNLVQEGFAVQAGVSHPCRELACEFGLYALANPAKELKLAKIEALIRESIAEFEQRGVKPEDLEKAKVQHEANTLYGLQSVRGKVSTLAFNETFFDNPDLIAEDLARYDAVTADDVVRVFNTYIKGKSAVIMSVVPEGRLDLIAAADTFTPAPLELKATPQTLQAVMPPVIVDSFDRSQVPPAGPNPQVELPALWRGKLENGIPVIGTQSLETPTVELLIALDGGNRLLSPEKAGLAQLTAAMMSESTERYSTPEFAEALELLGSRINVSASGYRTYVSVSALTRNLQPTIDLLLERLLHSAFDETDFARVKEQHLQGLMHSKNEPGWIASSAWSGLVYGEDNPQGHPLDGTLESVSALTLEDVKAFYAEQFRAGNAEVVVVGDLPQTELMSALAPLSQWQGGKTPWPEMQPMPQLGGPVIYLLDKPGSAQSVIRIGKRTVPYDATGEHFLSTLMNYPLGGAFNSRINLNLREDKGYTYGARSGFNAGPELGQFLASADVRSDATAASVAEFIKEISEYQANGMTAEELAFMKSSISQAEALKFETPGQKARFLDKLQRYDLSDDYVKQQGRIIADATLDELNAVAARELKLEQMIILVVGDRASNEEALRQLGYDVRLISL
ncbi:M16 family metallopeptidase [Ferrimonas balearica]|uniref:M16 family metallopeptidase n=1 Tax=Ferrimonas balearica TaxID=44012 RepID=UPI001C9972E6|nr:pitrilysin family protein [Ferrimonas balearica]MBY5921458.1 insulinase family protein [Ferrimonas balearica]MBY5995857.1 insulinase family protein [Ferrimonas balearica]